MYHERQSERHALSQLAKPDLAHQQRLHDTIILVIPGHLALDPLARNPPHLATTFRIVREDETTSCSVATADRPAISAAPAGIGMPQVLATIARIPHAGLSRKAGSDIPGSVLVGEL